MEFTKTNVATAGGDMLMGITSSQVSTEALFDPSAAYSFSAAGFFDGGALDSISSGAFGWGGLGVGVDLLLALCTLVYVISLIVQNWKTLLGSSAFEGLTPAGVAGRELSAFGMGRGEKRSLCHQNVPYRPVYNRRVGSSQILRRA